MSGAARGDLDPNPLPVLVVEPEEITDPALVIALALRYCGPASEVGVVECYHLTLERPVRGKDWTATTWKPPLRAAVKETVVQAVLVHDYDAYLLAAAIPGEDRLHWGFVTDDSRYYVPRDIMLKAFLDLESFFAGTAPLTYSWKVREAKAEALFARHGASVPGVDGYPL